MLGRGRKRAHFFKRNKDEGERRIGSRYILKRFYNLKRSFTERKNASLSADLRKSSRYVITLYSHWTFFFVTFE